MRCTSRSTICASHIRKVTSTLRSARTQAASHCAARTVQGISSSFRTMYAGSSSKPLNVLPGLVKSAAAPEIRANRNDAICNVTLSQGNGIRSATRRSRASVTSGSDSSASSGFSNLLPPLSASRFLLGICPGRGSGLPYPSAESTSAITSAFVENKEIVHRLVNLLPQPASS